MQFWKPGGDNTSLIDHVPVPIELDNGFTVNLGKRGVNWLADPQLWRGLDANAAPWAKGTVDTEFALPNSTLGGWETRTTALHTNFNNGVLPSEFAILHQKGSLLTNLDVIADTVNGTRKNVVRIKAVAENGTVTSAGLLQTADLFGSGRYEVVARFPPKKGLVFAVWSFHYEHHFDKSHLPQGQEDPQYLAEVRPIEIIIVSETVWLYPDGRPNPHPHRDPNPDPR